MKIAISSTGKTLEDEVDARFGRCAYFLIVNVEDKKIKNLNVIENKAKAQMGGTGISASEIVANEKPDAIITVNIGPKAFSAFKQLGIKIYQGQGKIENIVQQFIEEQLTEISDSTGPRHVD